MAVVKLYLPLNPLGQATLRMRAFSPFRLLRLGRGTRRPGHRQWLTCKGWAPPARPICHMYVRTEALRGKVP